MGKVGAIIQARMNSTRLPGKVMLKICEKTILTHDIERIKRSKCIDEIIVATTTNTQDDLIYAEARCQGVKGFRGSEENVLDRYYQAAEENNLDIIVRLTADCPLIDWEIIDAAVNTYLRNREQVDYVSNIIERTYPRGLDVEVFDFSLLKHLKKISLTLELQEHVTTHVELYPENYRLMHIKCDSNLEHLRWTLDTTEDFKMIKTVYEKLYPTNPEFSTKDILNLLNDYPEIVEINQHIEQKEVKRK